MNYRSNAQNKAKKAQQKLKRKTLNILISLVKEFFPIKKSTSQKTINCKIQTTSFDLYRNAFPSID